MSDTPLVDLCTRLYPLHRTLVSDGMDAALDHLADVLPLEAGYHIERYAPGAPAWTWRVPERFVVHEAWLAEVVEDGALERVVADVADHPLYLWSYAPSFEGVLTWDALRPHLVIGPADRPDAIPWHFRYYDRDWGFCLSWRQAAALRTDRRYRVRVRTEFRTGGGDGLAVGLARVGPVGHHAVLVCTNLCHPAQVNDSITGAVAAVEVARRLVARPLPPEARAVWFLWCPETIGSICYLAHNPVVARVTDAALCMEMLGTDAPWVLQHSRRGTARIDKIAAGVFRDAGLPVLAVPFRDPRAPLNDEIVLNGPGVDIPTVAFARWPYPEYHTSEDAPGILSEVLLRQAADLAEAIVRQAAVDYVPRRTFTGPLFLSGHGLWVDWRVDPALNAAVEQILLRLEGEHSIADIATEVGLPFDQVYRWVERVRALGLVTRRT